MISTNFNDFGNIRILNRNSMKQFFILFFIELITGCNGTFFPETPDAWDSGNCYRRATESSCYRVTNDMKQREWDKFIKNEDKN